MKITTTRFGELNVDESTVITFQEGIIGFPHAKRYVMLDKDKRGPFQWLQSVERPELAFVITDPMLFVPDYRAEVVPDDIQDLKLTSIARAVLVCIVTISQGCATVTANLAGPIVINPDNRHARQVVLTISSYSIRHDLLSLPPVNQSVKVR